MLSKKSRNNPILMEAYHVLLGYVELDRDGKIIPMDGPTGITAPADGAGRIRNFGITHVKKRYISGKSNKQVMFEAKKAFKNLGRGIYFFSQEDVYGCQLKSYVFYPVVLAFYENEDGQLQLSAFTARCLTARLAARIAIRQFEKATGNFLTRDEKEKEEKKNRKGDKKSDRDEKKKEARSRKQAEKAEDRKFREQAKEDERKRLAEMEKEWGQSKENKKNRG